MAIWSWRSQPLFAVANSNGASEEALASTDRAAETAMAAGLHPVTGHNRQAYQRPALVARRNGGRVCYVLDRGLLEAFGNDLSRELFPAARIWSPAYDPACDLTLSPFPLRAHSLADHNSRRDSLIFALADTVIVGEIRQAGRMERECLAALRRGRPVYLAGPANDTDAGLIAAGAGRAEPSSFAATLGTRRDIPQPALDEPGAVVRRGIQLVWGAFVVLFPLEMFRWAGMPPPNYPHDLAVHRHDRRRLRSRIRLRRPRPGPALAHRACRLPRQALRPDRIPGGCGTRESALDRGSVNVDERPDLADPVRAHSATCRSRRSPNRIARTGPRSGPVRKLSCGQTMLSCGRRSFRRHSQRTGAALVRQDDFVTGPDLNPVRDRSHDLPVRFAGTTDLSANLLA